MRAASCLLLLGLATGVAVSGSAPAGAPAPPRVFVPGPDGELVPLVVAAASHRTLPPSRDLAIGPGGALLFLSAEGELSALAGSDSLAVQAFGADLEDDLWPDAIAAGPTEVLLLVEQGREILSLGRRGEDLGRIRLPEEAAYRRGLALDRSGRIWLADPAAGDFLALSRGGQVLQRWRLDELLPGYRGPILAWCPDQSGGLYLAEGRPPRLLRLNAAGNRVGPAARLPDSGGEAIALAADGARPILLIGPRGKPLRFLGRGPAGALRVAAGGLLWTLAPDGP